MAPSALFQASMDFFGIQEIPVPPDGYYSVHAVHPTFRLTFVLTDPEGPMCVEDLEDPVIVLTYLREEGDDLTWMGQEADGRLFFRTYREALNYLYTPLTGRPK